MNKLLNKILLHENRSVDYINMYLLALLSAILYALHGVAFFCMRLSPFC